MPAVEPAGVSPEEPLHPGDQVRLRRLHDQMEMIAHQTVRMHLPAGLAAGLREGREEAFAVLVIREDIFPAVPPVQDMVDRPRKLQAQLPSHAREATRRERVCQYY